jgi:hypothetical protein
MTPEDATILAELDDEALAQVDALAAARGVTRKEMVRLLVLSGIEAEEREREHERTRG